MPLFLCLHDCAIGLFSCSEEAVRQLVSEGALESIVALTSHTDASGIVSAATSLLFSVASNAPSLRQYLGRAGAVAYFVSCLEELVASDGTLPHKYRIIDALCQCCRDANNRIKVREQGGLSILMSLLSNSKLAIIHDRIISALVCFIYDDASIAVLLHSRLVPTLVSHLYRAAGIAKQTDFIGLDSFDVCESLRMDSTETTDAVPECLDNAYLCSSDVNSAADQSTSFPLDTEVQETNDLLSCDSFTDFNIEKDSTDTAVLETLSIVGTLKTQIDQLNDDRSQGKLQFVGNEPVDSEPNTVEVFSKPSRYSINSPTYKAVSAWRMELAADENEDNTSDRRSPRNIWEGAQLYGENFSSASLRYGSVSPTRSLSSCSDGLRSVQSWSSSLCSSSPQKSPGVSPAWSLDSSGSGVYSPFSNSSYVYSDGACSPLCFSDIDETQPVSLSNCLRSESQLDAATASHVSDNQAFQAHCLSVTDVHSETTVNLTANAVHTELPAFVTDVSDTGQQNDNVGTSSELLSSVNASTGDEIDINALTVQSKSESGTEEESKEQFSDDGFDAESFQRKRQDERKFSRLLVIAKSMYASIETEPVLPSHQTKKRRRNSSGNTSPSDSIRPKFHCPDVSAKVNNKSSTTETADTNDLEGLPVKNLRNSSITDDTNSCAPAHVPQSLSLQMASDANHGEVNSDTESVVSDDISACSIHHQNVSRVTERNILTLLSRISHSPETVAHVMNAGMICGLLDYAVLASDPLPAAGRTLLRLSRSHHGFQRAVLCLFPVQAVWRMEPDWLSSPLSDNSCKHHNKESGYLCEGISSGHQNDMCVDVDSVDRGASSEDSQSRTQKINSRSKMTETISSRKKGNCCSTSPSNQVKNSSTKSAEAECTAECVISKLCDEVIANLSTVAISGYGQGVVSHLLLRGSRHQRERCVISLCILCRFVFRVIS